MLNTAEIVQDNMQALLKNTISKSEARKLIAKLLIKGKQFNQAFKITLEEAIEDNNYTAISFDVGYDYLEQEFDVNGGPIIFCHQVTDKNFANCDINHLDKLTVKLIKAYVNKLTDNELLDISLIALGLDNDSVDKKLVIDQDTKNLVQWLIVDFCDLTAKIDTKSNSENVVTIFNNIYYIACNTDLCSRLLGYWLKHLDKLKELYKKVIALIYYSTFVMIQTIKRKS